MSAKAYLEGISGKHAGQRIGLSTHPLLLGRGSRAHVRFFNNHISRQHAFIRYANGAYFIQDQGSKLGTLVNGRHISAQRLRDGDVIDIGGNTFSFRLGVAAPLAPVPAVQPQPSVSQQMEMAAARAVARSKSFVGDAFLILLLYYIGFFFIGLIFNIIRLSEANRITRESGIEPEGKGCLVALLVWHIVVPLVVLFAILATGGAILSAIGLDILF